MDYKKIILKDYFDFLGENDKNPTVDMFLPENMAEMNRENRKRPCMLICPGGGYEFLSHREGEPIAYHLLTEGFNVFIINYSIKPHKFPSQLCEVAATIELIYRNADEWNCDASKLLIMGFSAGGHLAAHYSTMYDCKEVRELFPQSKPVSGTVLGYPVITSKEQYTHKGSFMNLSGIGCFDEENFKYYSCELNVDETTPPAFIWHTFQDEDVSVMNSLLYAEALNKYKIPTELHIYPLGGHGLATSDIHTLWGNPDEDIKFAQIHEWLGCLKKWLKVMGFSY